MIIFNGTRYFHVNNGADLRIESSHNIIDYTQILLNGGYPEGKIFRLNENGENLIEMEHQDLLRKMCKCNDINLYLLGIEACKSMDVMTLQNLSENMPMGLSQDEVRKFVALNKYEKEMLINSGFSNYELTECYRALLNCKETFGENIEYAADLNEFLHQNYTQDASYSENPILDELIAIYYQYPHIADLLSHGNRRGASFIYSLLHPSQDKNDKEKWLFNKEHIAKLSKLENVVSYYYSSHSSNSESIANYVERNIYHLTNSGINPSLHSVDFFGGKLLI